MCATDRPFARGFARGLEELVVTVPRLALRPRADIQVSKPLVTSFRADSPGNRQPGGDRYARALARLAGRATQAEATPPLIDEDMVLDLVAMLATGGGVALATAHRVAARCYIDEHLTDPGLGAEEIAAAIGLSERQLSRVFAADGTSVPRHVLTRRLQLAYALLAAKPARVDSTAGTVADVAARCGFTSAAYFSHSFRRHFGVRAGDVRGQFAG